jgi:hypothetical protein
MRAPETVPVSFFSISWVSRLTEIPLSLVCGREILQGQPLALRAISSSG